MRPSLTAPRQPGCPAGDPGAGLLPDDRVTPEEMSFDCSTGKYFSAEFADFTHLWIGIVLFVCGPGGAHCSRRFQAAVLNQSQADTHAHGDQVQECIAQAFANRCGLVVARASRA